MKTNPLITRRQTRQIMVGNIPVGGGAPISVQTMTNTETCDVGATLAQINNMVRAGVDIVRVSVPSMDAAEAFRKIRSQVEVPLIADIHFDYRIALKVLENGVDCLRINPGNIQIEVTETALVDNSERINIALLDLVALGIEIAMDDFGTGYSSLDLLSRLPISALKLDQGVVRRMAEDVKNTHIVRSSLYMARELSIKTVAEGVESRGTYTYLMAAGCNEVQGFWISPPLPLDEYISLCESNPQWPGSSFGLLYNAWVNHISYRRKVLDAALTLSMTEQDEWTNLPKMDLAHSPARCRLGQWYMGEVSESEEGRRQYKQLEEPHRLMHAAGASLIKAIRTQSTARDITRATRIFLEYSDVVDAEVSRIVERDLEKTFAELDVERGKEIPSVANLISEYDIE